MSKKNKQPDLECDQVERLTYEAMRHHGLIPPMTLEEVARIEGELDEIELPASLSDPDEILKRLDNDCDENDAGVPRNCIDTDAARNLARAAREGGTISDEVERQMREDRKRAEQKRDDST